MWYFIKTKQFIKTLFRQLVWDLPNSKNEIYLTFDDGPTPQITNWVLNQLEQYNAKATFFCIGKNIEKNPEIFSEIINQGHRIGNHTQNHLNGWKTNSKLYIKNIQAAQQVIEKQGQNTHLFRPPYGKLTFLEIKKIKKLGLKIIMWDVLSADFDPTIAAEKCLENVIKNTTSGSIIVFHDSEKAFKNLEYVLPKALEYLSKNNFVFAKM
jgi:peptidoglycan-N-acetylglucosamine deacetylase